MARQLRIGTVGKREPPFDDGSLVGIFSIDNSDPGVAFSDPAVPGNLPGANNASPAFVATTGFSADSDPPVQPNGVNPGETLGILFACKAVRPSPTSSRNSRTATCASASTGKASPPAEARAS